MSAMTHTSSASASSTASIALPRPPTTQHVGWRQRLWCFLFPDEESAGVEGAALHYGHHASETAAVMGDAMEPWHYMQVPLSRVIIFLRLQQRLADQWVQGWMYAPFYVFLLLFVFVGPGRGAAQTVVDFDAMRRGSLAQADTASTVREAVLMEAFRLDTEATAPTSLTNSVSDFVSGNSARHPWSYSWYNDSVNVWTPPPKRRLAVDAQVKNVAAVYHEPVFVSLTSIRSRRDVLRWLQLQLLRRLWNCKRPEYQRPWRDTVTGNHYQLGAVRLISRRYRQKNVTGSRAEDTVMVATNSGAGGSSEGAPSVDELNAAVATPQLRTQRASPPEIPRSICGAGDTRPLIGENPSFDFDSNVGGYVALLPFAASCYDVNDVLGVMQTPTKSVLWPPAYNRSLEMRMAWMMYTETNRVLNTSPATTTKLCNSFIFDPAVSEVVVQYVEYGTKTNQYTVVEVSFTMSSGGAVVRPRLTTLTLHALQWRFSFTPLAFSITLAMTIIFYGNYLVRRMLSQYARKLSRISRQQRSRSQRLWCALRVLSHTQSFVHLLALCMTAAAVGSWWHSLVSLTGVPDSRYADRDVYPQSIDNAVRRSSVLLPRLSASAVFFATAGLLRFANATPGLWLCVQTLTRSVPQLLLICCVWMAVNVGVTFMCVLLYGGVLFEFSSFGDAFTMLLFAFLDGGRSLLNSFTLARQTGHTAIFAQDNSLPGIRGSRLGRIEPVPLDQRAVTLAVSSHDLFVGFLLFFFYVQNLIMFVWGVLTILESYRGVLLLPEAEALPLWRGVRTLQFSSLTRIFNAEYAKEALRRLLLARGEAVMLREMEYFLRLGYARAPATAAAAASSAAHHHHHHRSDGAAGETAVSLPMVLWLLPRELQPEYGAAHLRRLWYLCVAAVVAAQRAEQPWKATRWRQHWEQQPNSLSGWMHASLPADDRIEGQAARVGLQLEELPNSVVRYVEGKFM